MIKLIGIPFDANSSFLKGPSLAPARIRMMEAEGSANCYAENGIEIRKGINYDDCGDIVFNTTHSADGFALIQQTIAAQFLNNNKIISLGGDHSVSYPLIDAFTKVHTGLHVLHLDAHADLYENFDDNPYSHASPFARILEQGRIASLTQVGIRTLNTHQRQQAERYSVHVIEMKNFNFSFIEKLQSPLYISVDLDVLDPAFAPGVSHHEPGGISTRELLTIIQSIKANIVGADIVEYNPVRDINNITAMVAYKVLKELMAKML